ncbi:DUF308 domain-containing protein [Limosilactobacillus sp. STM2_1]|uniref:DUF308 domain-containing protein n=1 Tax=Limosilactobacillus rudii TaxID=2759755 RepID=A0A7W3UK88_9LACO|nr:DUF308 domain-containing protein [Limosilactobacillus rudii]MBB1080042.1 DUF308 domain-containing protein [Limosilactobacillus rudii]MBB1096470.1 DUF308 domain-containing protein [Limosilactobacillus rudii]MCD7133529.1 DUF308 domain-containing protein [Limosilactobacillus rudii]
MFEETKKGFDWFSLIVGILFLIAGIASFNRPDRTLRFLAIVAGVAFIFRGIYELWFRQRISQLLQEASGWLIFSAILDIILGIIFLFQPSFGVLFIAIIFAIWFILDSITELLSAKFFKEFHRGYYWFIIILAIISLILGIILLFSPLLSAITVVWLVSTFLIVFGIMKIIQAF